MLGDDSSCSASTVTRIFNGLPPPSLFRPPALEGGRLLGVVKTNSWLCLVVLAPGLSAVDFDGLEVVGTGVDLTEDLFGDLWRRTLEGVGVSRLPSKESARGSGLPVDVLEMVDAFVAIVDSSI